jgi:hypothetical protein
MQQYLDTVIIRSKNPQINYSNKTKKIIITTNSNQQKSSITIKKKYNLRNPYIEPEIIPIIFHKEYSKKMILNSKIL